MLQLRPLRAELGLRMVMVVLMNERYGLEVGLDEPSLSSYVVALESK